MKNSLELFFATASNRCHKVCEMLEYVFVNA